jgi:hypothetical protein
MEAGNLIRQRVFTTPEHEFNVPEFRVSVGWPVGKRRDTNVIGECHNTASFDDGIAQIFITPKMKDRLPILRTLVHEMIHVADDCQNGHRGFFAYVFKHIRMTGKRTETEAGEELRLKLADIADELGAYPHSALRLGGKKSGQKKQASRMFKVACTDRECNYVIRAARSNINRGLPTCFCGEPMAEEV